MRFLSQLKVLAHAAVAIGLCNAPLRALPSPMQSASFSIQGTPLPTRQKQTFTAINPPTNRVSRQQMMDALRDLSTSSVYAKYKSFILMIPRSQNDLLQKIVPPSVSSVSAMPFQVTQLYTPESEVREYLQLNMTLVFNRDERAQTAFDTTEHKGDIDFNPTYAAFVRHSGFQSAVPVPVALTMQGSFVQGLVARLSLEALSEFGSSGTSNASALDFKPACGVVPAVIAAGEFEQPSTWAKGKGFSTVVTDVSSRYPIIAQSMIYGWCAGDDLMNASEPGHDYRRDLSTVLRYRFSPAQLGEMFGFAMAYLTGFEHGATVSKSPRTRAAESSSVQNAPAGDLKVRADATIFGMQEFAARQFRAGDPKFSSIADQTLSLLLAQLDATSRSVAVDGRTKDNLRLFVSGYGRGSLSAVSVVYDEAFQMGYDVGYASGFNDGYSRGFADGYQQAWQEASIVINDLKSQLDKESDGLLATFGKAAAEAAGTEVGKALGTLAVAIILG